jgi:hypothetical protein
MDLDDKELLKRLDNAVLAEKLTSDPAWALFKEIAKRIVDRAVNQFALAPPDILDDRAALADLRATIKKYKFALFSEIETLKQDGVAAHEEARQRNILEDEQD